MKEPMKIKTYENVLARFKVCLGEFWVNLVAIVALVWFNACNTREWSSLRGICGLRAITSAANQETKPWSMVPGALSRNPLIKGPRYTYQALLSKSTMQFILWILAQLGPCIYNLSRLDNQLRWTIFRLFAQVLICIRILGSQDVFIEGVPRMSYRRHRTDPLFNSYQYDLEKMD